MMNDQDYGDAVPAYVLGALDPEERAAFEARMMLDSALQAEVLRYQEIVTELPLAVTPVRPPAALKMRLLAEIKTSTAPPPAIGVTSSSKAVRANPPAWRRTWVMPAALSAMLLVICLAIALLSVFSQLQTATQTNAQLATQLANTQRTVDDLRRSQQNLTSQLEDSRRREQELEAQVRTNADTLARLQQENAANGQLVRFLSAGDLTTRDLGATNEAPAARGAMYMRPGQRDAIVVVSGLPPLPAGDTYQFWLAKNGVPTQFNAGMLLIDATGNGQLVLQAPTAVNDFTEVMVTLEHEQHAAVPSKMTLLYGTL